jgi:hypothetical protein
MAGRSTVIYWNSEGQKHVSQKLSNDMIDHGYNGFGDEPINNPVTPAEVALDIHDTLLDKKWGTNPERQW